MEKVNSELRLLELRVASATTVPDLEDLDASVPVIVENADGTILPHKVDFPSGPANKLAVIS